MPASFDTTLRTKGGRGTSTTIGLVATDATLTKAQAMRLAIMAHDGLARAVLPAHAPLDGDTIFAAATGSRPMNNPRVELTELGHVATQVMARAIARGVYEASRCRCRGRRPRGATGSRHRADAATASGGACGGRRGCGSDRRNLYCLGYREQDYALAEAWGAAPFRTPFLDMHAVTAAVECHRLGFDVYVQDPCDVFGRVHGYSPVWLWLAVLPITTAWDNALGLGLVLLFLVALAFLRPGAIGDKTMLITLGAVSSATMFALERANVDLLMFVMAMLAVRLRTTGYAVSLLAGMLKFYPIVLLVLAVRERLVTCLVVWAAAAGVVALWFALDGQHPARHGEHTVHASFDDNVFGAHNLPFGLAELLGLPHAAAIVLQVLLLAIMLGVAATLARRVQVHALTEAESLHLMAGSVLLVSCFVMAQNVCTAEYTFCSCCRRWRYAGARPRG